MTKLTFLGTGTSQGVPVVSCGCWVCRSEDSRDKRLRTSALIQHQGYTILIDAGPDFRQQMLHEKVMGLDAILLTHAHKDHIGGLDDVRAFNYTSGRAVDVYAEERVQITVRKDFDYAFAENKYPGAPDITLHTIDERPFKIGDLEVVPIRGYHYKLPVLGFKIGEVAYITDMNHIEQSEIDKIHGVDTLVINALRRELHMSHFTLSQALHISYLVSPRQTFLTHVSHQMGRHAQISQELPPNTYFAYDGLSIETLK